MATADPDPAEVAETDQKLALLRDAMRIQAKNLHDYFAALVDEGFTRPEALELTMDLNEREAEE